MAALVLNFFVPKSNLGAIMKTRETNLSRIVNRMYGISNNAELPSISTLNQDQSLILKEVYYSLGGCLKDIPFKFGSWDIVTTNFIIELDEEQHFNRYRSVTLQSSIYDHYKWFDVKSYIGYCQSQENNCLKKAIRGGYWKNDSTEKQFGIAADNGDFSGNGSPRWKQRAFYDFCKDFYSVVTQIPVYRFSIYDNIETSNGLIPLGDALAFLDVNAVIHFLETKITH